MSMRVAVAAVLVVLSPIVGALAVSAQAGDDANARARKQLIGSYRLVSYTNYDAAGKESASPYRIGQISYDAAGRMSAQLMYGERVAFTAGSQPTEAQRAAAYSSYVAYFGRYTLDAAAGTVTHHVEGATNPNMVKSDLVRYFEFSPDGKSLFLSVKTGGRVVGRLRWDRHQ